jgi:hypothetical protein
MAACRCKKICGGGDSRRSPARNLDPAPDPVRSAAQIKDQEQDHEHEQEVKNKRCQP